MHAGRDPQLVPTRSEKWINCGHYVPLSPQWFRQSLPLPNRPAFEVFGHEFDRKPNDTSTFFAPLNVADNPYAR